MGGSGISDDLMREMEGKGGGSTDKMMSAGSSELNRLRDREDASRCKCKGLRYAPSRQRREGECEAELGLDDGSPSRSQPGTDKSLHTLSFFTQPTTTDIYTLSLHDALPI